MRYPTDRRTSNTSPAVVHSCVTSHVADRDGGRPVFGEQFHRRGQQGDVGGALPHLDAWAEGGGARPREWPCGVTCGAKRQEVSGGAGHGVVAATDADVGETHCRDEEPVECQPAEQQAHGGVATEVGPLVDASVAVVLRGRPSHSETGREVVRAEVPEPAADQQSCHGRVGAKRSHEGADANRQQRQRPERPSTRWRRPCRCTTARTSTTPAGDSSAGRPSGRSAPPTDGSCGTSMPTSSCATPTRRTRPTRACGGRDSCSSRTGCSRSRPASTSCAGTTCRS
jgi:hypothetical protein